MINSILRLSDVFQGTILIDNVDTSTVPFLLCAKALGLCRKSRPICWYARFNLDPNKASDEEIWKTLRDCNLKHSVDSLDMPVQEAGGNLSVGQRQCLSLARALLHNAKIYIMDEATANVDAETDSLIQGMVRANFKDKTILTIAHRLDTIMDSDKVVVLERGKLVEFEMPSVLLSQKGSLFKAMVEKSGMPNI